jgi:D-alanyl-D-alanine carboxypeptidase (penicillin-binding protein 5/6)
MMFSTVILLFGSGIWSVGLESIDSKYLPEYEISSIEKKWEVIPAFTANSVLLIEENSMTPIMSYNSDVSLPMASLTKLMTALIIVESHNLSELVKISKISENTEGSSMKLKEGEVFTVEDLLKGLLIKSGNDSAIALAKYHSGSVYKFVNEMNSRAKDLYLSNTSFTNPHGLDNINHYSSSKDIIKLARLIMKNKEIQNIVKTSKVSVFSKEGNEHILINTNNLLNGIFPVYGIKTGTTEKAKQCLLLFIKNNNKNYYLVILGSDDRYQDARNILYKLIIKHSF